MAFWAVCSCEPLVVAPLIQLPLLALLAVLAGLVLLAVLAGLAQLAVDRPNN